jgi:hypothetical protein
MNLATYERVRTMSVLHRFFRSALMVGRMPSLLGREIFRSRATAMPARAFEDAVVFVCDVERCLRELGPIEQRLIAFCILEDRSEWEAARRFQRSQSDVSRRLGQTLDLLHETFCRVGLLKRPAATASETKGARA